MKKVFNSLLIILLLILVTGCNNIVGPDVEQVPIDFDGSTLPTENIAGTNYLKIDRRNITKGTDWVEKYIDCWDYQGKTIIDYFVNPNEEYEYRFTYESQNDAKSAVSSITKLFKTKAGPESIGELAFESLPVVNYDKKTGIMTFDVLPKFPDNAKNALSTQGQVSEWKSVIYKSDNSYYAINTEIEPQINFGMKLRNKNDYGKELTLRSLGGYIAVNRIFYNVNLTGNDLPEIAKIVVPDTRKSLTFITEEDGIKINIPECSKENADCRIWRRYAGSTENWDLIYIGAEKFKDNNRKEIKDYFVIPGKKYEYYINFYEPYQWQPFFETKISEVTATGGKGEVSIKGNPTAEYNENTNKLKLSSVTNIHDYLEGIKGTEKNGHILITYRNGNIDLVNSKMDEKGEFYLGTPQNSTYGDYKFDEMDLYLMIDGINYHKYYNFNTLKEQINLLPETIKIKDTRVSIKLESVENGIKINLPEPITGAEYFTIGRQNVKNPVNNGDMLYWYIKSEDVTKMSVVDYFVTKGVEYEYTLYYRNNKNGNIIQKSQPAKFTAVNGLENDLNSNIEVSYDNTTGIMNVTPFPDLSKLKGIIGEKDSINADLYYKFPDNNKRFIGRFDINGKINWFDQISSNENGKYLEKTLIQDGFNLEAKIDGISYKNYISKEDLKKNVPNIPDTIVVPDNKIAPTIEQNENGIFITVPKNWDLPTLGRFVVSRKDLSNNSINDRYIIFDREGKNPKTSAIDYFVNPEKSYSYKLEFSSDNIRYSTKFSEPITPTAGYGEIDIKNANASYNSETGIMTLTNMPDFRGQTNVMNSDNKIRLSMCYEDEINGVDNWCNFDAGKNGLIPEEINWTEAHVSGEGGSVSYGNKLKLDILDISTCIDNVWYEKRMRKSQIMENIQGIPETITIPDLRADLGLKQSDKGIEITLPKELQISSGYITIKRRPAGTDTHWDEIDFTITDKNKTIIDYFVEANKKYDYYASCIIWTNDSSIKKETKISTIEAKNGVGELAIRNNPSVKYEEGTGIMTIEPLPNLLNLINDVIVDKKNYEIELEYAPKVFYNHWTYAKMDNSTGRLNWGEALADEMSSVYYDESLYFYRLNLSVTLGNVTYRKIYHPDENDNFVKTLNSCSIIVHRPK